MATARPYTPPRGGPTTMTVLSDKTRELGIQDKYVPRYSSDASRATSRWKPHKKEQVETAMELLPADDEENIDQNTICNSASSSRPSSSSSRPGSSSSRRAPPIQRPDSGRRTPSTPTKQVTLQAVPRKPVRDDEEQVEKINWAEHQAFDEERLKRADVEGKIPPENEIDGKDHMVVEDIETSDESSSDAEEDVMSGEEEIKAPNELLLEFISCLQEGDYENGKKLCKMILIYEPDNPEAIKFQSLIDEKIDLEAELAEQSSDSGSEEGSSDDDTDDGESDDSDEDSSTDSSSEEEDEEEQDNCSSIKAALEIP